MCNCTAGKRPQGDWLLALELVHIVQQQPSKLRPSDLNKAGSFLCERQANLIADQLVLRKRAQNLSSLDQCKTSFIF